MMTHMGPGIDMMTLCWTGSELPQVELPLDRLGHRPLDNNNHWASCVLHAGSLLLTIGSIYLSAGFIKYQELYILWHIFHGCWLL
jgi:hypothetical protein